MSTQASIEPGTWALVTVFFLTDALRVYSALDDAAFMRASKSSSATSSRRERELCSSLGSHLPVFKFTGACLRGVHGGEVRNKASSMWVGAKAWRRARARGDRRRLPIPFRRKTQPTAKPPPVIVVGAVDVADLGFRRLSLVREARVGAQGFTDLESRPKRCTSRMDAEHAQKVRV